MDQKKNKKKKEPVAWQRNITAKESAGTWGNDTWEEEEERGEKL